MRTTALTLLLGLMGAAPAAAEPAQDGSWLAWHGCWRLADGEAEGQVLCVLPGAVRAEARFATFVDGALTGSTVVRADGTPRGVDEGGCTGTETARWSADGRRVLLRGELDCDGVRRISTGAIALVADNEWVDVRSATVGGQHASRVLRYRAVPTPAVPAEAAAALDPSRDLAREAARLHAAAALDVDDVVDAASSLETPALQALLVAYGSGFPLDARTLARLESAGIDGSVVDIMVALSYPDRFAIRDGTVERDESVYRFRGYAWEDECWDPVFRRYYYGADCFRYRRPYYSRWGYWAYSPWGYDPWGWRYGSGAVVVVVPAGDAPAPPPRGSLVKGGGYTRGGATTGAAQPRSGSGSGGSASPAGTSGAASPAATSGGSSSGRTAQPRAGSSGGGDSARPAGGSSGGAAQPSASGGQSSSGSSQSSSGSSGRTAQPRPGGGDTPPAE